MSSSNKQPLNYSRGERVRAWSSISLPHIYTLFFFLVLHRPPPNPTSWNVYSSLLSRWIFPYPSLQNTTHIKNWIYSQYIHTHTHPSLISCNWGAGFVLSGFSLNGNIISFLSHIQSQETQSLQNHNNHNPMYSLLFGRFLSKLSWHYLY